jgi:hypothetical protein
VNRNACPVTGLVASGDRNRFEIKFQVTGDKKIEMAVPVEIDERTS